MKKESQQLKNQIETIRKKLHKVLEGQKESENSLLEISEELDRLIVEYMKNTG